MLQQIVPLRLCALLALVAVMQGCITVPETGRRALRFMPEQQLAEIASSQFSEMKREMPVSSDPAYTERLNRIGERVARASGVDPVGGAWEFVVFEDEAVNAFAMPGGKVGFYTGLMDLAESDDEIAAVMGHEIAHVGLRHGNERVSQAMAAQVATMGAHYATRDMEDQTQTAVMVAVGLGAQLGVLLPYSRLHESEADRIGLLYSARAGYDPRAAVTFWERMESQAEGGAPPEFLSTHPSHGRRIADLHEMMPEAIAEYEQAVEKLGRP